MQDKSHYTNGQKIHEQIGDVLTYFYKNGQLKARGISINGTMQGEWVFWRETGQLWQIGNYKDNLNFWCLESLLSVSAILFTFVWSVFAEYIHLT